MTLPKASWNLQHHWTSSIHLHVWITYGTLHKHLEISSTIELLQIISIFGSLMALSTGIWKSPAPLRFFNSSLFSDVLWHSPHWLSSIKWDSKILLRHLSWWLFKPLLFSELLWHSPQSSPFSDLVWHSPQAWDYSGTLHHFGNYEILKRLLSRIYFLRSYFFRCLIMILEPQEPI